MSYVNDKGELLRVRLRKFKDPDRLLEWIIKKLKSTDAEDVIKEILKANKKGRKKKKEKMPKVRRGRVGRPRKGRSRKEYKDPYATRTEINQQARRIIEEEKTRREAEILAEIDLEKRLNRPMIEGRTVAGPMIEEKPRERKEREVKEKPLKFLPDPSIVRTLENLDGFLDDNIDRKAQELASDTQFYENYVLVEPPKAANKPPPKANNRPPPPFLADIGSAKQALKPAGERIVPPKVEEKSVMDLLREQIRERRRQLEERDESDDVIDQINEEYKKLPQNQQGSGANSIDVDGLCEKIYKKVTPDRQKLIDAMYSKGYLKSNSKVGPKTLAKVFKDNPQTLKEFSSLLHPSFNLKPQSGGSKERKERGLSNSEIDHLMKGVDGFLGTVPRDQIMTLNFPKNKPFSLVMNTDKSGGPGIHWVAMFCDPVGSKSIEYFDSFADPMPADVREVINKVVKKIKPTTFLKLKENGVVQQDNDTMNCGYFAINFLMKRHRGVSFADATGYNDNLKRYNAEEGEKEISKFKRKFALI